MVITPQNTNDSYVIVSCFNRPNCLDWRVLWQEEFFLVFTMRMILTAQ